MFRLNRLTDYAVVVMAQMALSRDAIHTTGQIADDTGVPVPTVAKLMNALARGGLITSQRGAAGGYRLTRTAEEITVTEIIQALEGPIALTACVDGSADHCGSEGFCPMRGNWDKVNQAIRKALDGVTLADMTVGFPAPSAEAVASRDAGAAMRG